MIIDLPDLDLLGFIRQEERADRVALYRADRVLAHRELFAKRHPLETCEAQQDAIREFHGEHPRLVIEAFRGFAKTTMGEEGMLLRAAFGEFRYGVVLGNTYSMAAARLSSIKREIDRNRELHALFGELRGPVWREDRVELSTGVVIQAVGARQSMRGAKEESRPDFALVDDLEDQDWVRDPDAIEQNKNWFMSAFLPALADPLRTPIRWIGTPLAENCLLNQFKVMTGWRSKIYPVKFRGEAGEWEATWPAKHPMEDIERIERSYVEAGNDREFVQEYMCESESKAEALFLPSMFHYDPARIRTWQALYGMVDPARTTKKNSAMTGWAVWSWDAGGRMTIWEAGGAYLKPDEVVALLFRLHETWGLTELGIEEDGLNEWAMQPIRDMQVRRGVIPVKAMRAPRGKIDFIRGLQPYFSATNAVQMVGAPDAFRELTRQLLAFPRDLMDVPNALAYALIMRPGETVYPDFATECIFDGAELSPGDVAYLAMNADGQRVTAALCQGVKGVERVLADWVEEGNPADCVGDMVAAAAKRAGRRVRCVIGPDHADKWRNFGLQAALARAGAHVTFGTRAADIGRGAVRAALQKRARGLPGLMVSTDAGWTLRGLIGGFAYTVEKGNVISTEPARGVYRTMVEGVEAYAGLAHYAQADDEGEGRWETTSDGRRFRSTLRG